MRRILFVLSAFILASGFLSAQVINPASWEFSTRELGNGKVDLIFKATIQEPWHMYGLHIPEGGPIATAINFNGTAGFRVVGEPQQSPEPEIVDDQIFNMQLELHSGTVTFTQQIERTSDDNIIIEGTIEYMTCSDMQCVLGDHDFTFRLQGGQGSTGGATIGNASAGTVPGAAGANADVNDDVSGVAVTGEAEESAQSQEQGNNPFAFDSISAIIPSTTTAPQSSSAPISGSLLGILLLSMVAGLGGLLTPCVYPMIPMTVSYFLRGDKSRARSVSQALVFGFSIVLIYTLIGVLVAVFKNPNAVNNFTTHWLVNLIFFLIFITLSASFFGMFEIILPSGLANRVDRQADKGGYAGAFFMALAMVILSFSCTGPIVASLLIKASEGDVLEPVIGMAGFSVIFAIPFTLFAIFPSWLKNLPKSGGWLNSIKVFFAFIMLAFSFYFLSKIDQTYHLNLLSRELYISIWAVLFGLLGFYLLGKIRFAHDSELTHLTVPRFVFSAASFVLAIFLLTGLVGNELRGLSTLLPPADRTTTVAESLLTGPSAGSSTIAGNPETGLCSMPSYADFLSLPHGLEGYFSYDEALACAGEQQKPVLVDFVGHTCSNCKKMYAEVWSDPRVLELLRDKFVVVALYTDDRTKLPEYEWITSSVDGKVKNTIGKVNQDLQISRFNSNALPMYTIVDAQGNELTSSHYTYSPDVDAFIRWLEEGLENQGADMSTGIVPGLVPGLVQAADLPSMGVSRQN